MSHLTRLTRSVPRRPPRTATKPDPNAVHRQPRRDRDANHADLLAAGHSCGRAGHRRTRSARPARRQRRRGGGGRCGRRRTPPRLRVPRRVGGVRRGRDRGRDPLGRPAAGGDPPDGRQGRRTPPRRESRRPGPPRLRRRRPVGRGTHRGRAADRAAGPRQARSRWRREGHADRAGRGSAGRCTRGRPSRGDRGIRRWPPDPRALPRGATPRRDPGAVRRPRQRRPPRRARLLDPAAAPEGARGDAVTGRRPGAAPSGWARRRSRSRAPSGTSAPARANSSSTTAANPSSSR